MRVRATLFSFLVVVILTLTSQGVPVAQQNPDGQAPAGRGGGGGRGGGAARSQAEKDYVPPVRSPLNKANANAPAGDGCDVAQPGSGRLADVPADLRRAELQPAGQRSTRTTSRTWNSSGRGASRRARHRMWTTGPARSSTTASCISPCPVASCTRLMPRRAISSGSTATRWRRVFPPGATGGLRGGLVLYDDKAFIFPADGKIDAINVKDGTKAFEASHVRCG